MQAIAIRVLGLLVSEKHILSAAATVAGTILQTLFAESG
jgi:hypothetical protein